MAAKKPTIEQRLEAIAMNLELTSQAQERTAQELAQMAKLAKSILTNHNIRITALERGKR